ncbi:hypothetical protein RKAS3_02350 [Rhodoluna sp. KAS3]|nr:hypothetical protein RKAS3_02350 [Rhodoluna sp. KAS3]
MDLKSAEPNLWFRGGSGYCIDPTSTPDKDGISAALMVAAIARRSCQEGRTISDRLDEMGELYGHFATGQISIRVEDLSVIANLMSKLRNDPPKNIDGVSATFTDLKIGSPDLGPTDGLRFDLADGPQSDRAPIGHRTKTKVLPSSDGFNQGRRANRTCLVEYCDESSAQLEERV